MSKIINVSMYSELKFLYDSWALTFEGLDLNDIEKVIDYIKEKSKEPVEPVAYVIKGQYMNEVFKLTGSNAYPDDLNIVAFYPFGSVIAMFIGARWFTDIVDNNAEREGYHPFKKYSSPPEEDYEEEWNEEDYEDEDYINEATQAADVSVGEIYDYLKKSTLVDGATIDDILKDPEATAWEYAYQVTSTTNKEYNEEEFLDVYSKALTTLKKGKR